MSRPKDVFSRLETEHELVSQLMDELMDAEPAERATILRTLATELLSHAKAEEETVYSVLADKEEAEELVQEAYVEHEEVEGLVQELLALIPTDDGFAKKLTELQEAVEHHVEEEEGELIPAGRNALSGPQLALVGEEYADAKERFAAALDRDLPGRRAPTAPPAAADLPDLAERTKAELYEMARAEDIEGRSKMTKEELARELRNH